MKMDPIFPPIARPNKFKITYKEGKPNVESISTMRAFTSFSQTRDQIQEQVFIPPYIKWNNKQVHFFLSH